MEGKGRKNNNYDFNLWYFFKKYIYIVWFSLFNVVAEIFHGLKNVQSLKQGT